MAPKLRCTGMQKNKLIDYMITHPNFAKSVSGGSKGSSKHDAQWQRLARMLRQFGPDKSVLAWKNTWRDLIRRAQKGNVEQNNTRNTAQVPELGVEEQILSAIGPRSSVPKSRTGPPISRSGGEGVSSDGQRATASTHRASGSPVPGPSGLQRRLSTPRPVPRPQPTMPTPRQARPSEQPGPRPPRSEPAMFTTLQKGTNAVLQLIHAELVKSNELRREQIEVLRGILSANQLDQIEIPEEFYDDHRATD